MPTNIFERLTRLFGVAGTRRATLSALLGTALLALALDTSAAKGKRKAKGKQRNQTTRKNNGEASGQAKTENHCTTPFGLDLNATYGISAQIVTGFCHEVGSGERWISSGAPWFVNDTFESVPTPEEGFVPAGDTPVEDFIAKFTALKLVIDAGTRQEKTVVFPNDGNVFTGPATLFPGNPEEWALVIPITLGTVQPLPVGDHVVDVYWVFGDVHCDGVAANIVENCFPEGETQYVTVAFEVTPGHH
jgi:hypothetical protein